jgi:hypothetical protein
VDRWWSRRRDCSSGKKEIRGGKGKQQSMNQGELLLGLASTERERERERERESGQVKWNARPRRSPPFLVTVVSLGVGPRGVPPRCRELRLRDRD